MFTYTSGNAIVNGVRLHFYRTDGDRAPIVLVHGIVDDGLCWTPVAERLAKDHEVIMLDVRAHGKSEAPEDGYTFRNLAAELAGVITELKLEKPVLMGHSMGAINSLLTAGLYPDLPRALIMEDAPPFWNPPDPQALKGKMYTPLEQWMRDLKRSTADELMNKCRAENPHWQEAEFKPWVDAKQRFSPMAAEMLHPADFIEIDFPSVAAHVTCPALFIAADPERGAASQPEDIERLKSHLPQLQIAPVANAGHSVRRDQFAKYMEIVQGFLSRV